MRARAHKYQHKHIYAFTEYLVFEIGEMATLIRYMIEWLVTKWVCFFPAHLSSSFMSFKSNAMITVYRL